MGLTHPPGFFPIVGAPTRTHARCRSYNAPIFLDLKPTDLSSLYAIVNRLPPLCGPRPFLRPSDQVARNDFHYQMPAEEDSLFRTLDTGTGATVCLPRGEFFEIHNSPVLVSISRHKELNLLIDVHTRDNLYTAYAKLTWIVTPLRALK